MKKLFCFKAIESGNKISGVFKYFLFTLKLKIIFPPIVFAVIVLFSFLSFFLLQTPLIRLQREREREREVDKHGDIQTIQHKNELLCHKFISFFHFLYLNGNSIVYVCVCMRVYVCVCVWKQANVALTV